MATIASMNVDLTANTAAFKVALDRATQQLETFGKKSDGIMAKLKESFGRGSAFFQVGKLLAGGGAIVGLNLITKQFAAMTEKAVELKNKLSEGTISGGEFGSEMAKSLPILGHIVEAGENINELITGNKAELQRANEIEKQLEMSTNRIKDAFAAGDKAASKMADTIDRLKTEIAAVGASSNVFTKTISGGIGEATKIVFDQINARAGILNPKGGPTLDALRSKRAELLTKIAAITNDTESGFNRVGKSGMFKGFEDPALGGLRTSLASVQREITARMSASQNTGGIGEAIALALVGTKATKELVNAGEDSAKTFWGGFMKWFSDPNKAITDVTKRIDDDLKDFFSFEWQDVAEKMPTAAKTHSQTVSQVQPARSFRFAEAGIPGQRSGIFERVEVATKRNTEALQRNYTALERNTRAAGGDSGTDTTPQFSGLS